ncbi:MAG: N-acetylglucosamine-6-phosphate deacetylase [Clostridia bacterium]|nr:N-acetylglucosamine-6-phosphate deacetylase [Clostridia bacterium]
MSLLIKNVNVYHSDSMRFVPGALYACGDLIKGVYLEGDALPEIPDAEVVDGCGSFLVPGLVDTHTHGIAGGDFISASQEKMAEMARAYLRGGVTSVMPTLASAPFEDMVAAVKRITEMMRAGTDLGAFCGVHLEGRYLNAAKRGAHAPALLASLEAKELDVLIGEAEGAVHVSAAFELDEDGAFAARALSLGATLGLAHTTATYAQAKLAILRGVNNFTHLFNAMPPLHHRDGGAVCAAFDSDVFAELIVDGVHVSPEMVALAYRNKREWLVLITDSMEATDCADGEYSIAGMPVTVKHGKAVTHDGAIAGSTLHLLDGVKNLSEYARIPLAQALYHATAAPAKAIGLYGEIGEIAPGKRADMLLLDEQFHLHRVIKDGVEVDA